MTEEFKKRTRELLSPTTTSAAKRRNTNMEQLKGKKVGELLVEEYETMFTTLSENIYDKISKLNLEVAALKSENENRDQ